MKRSSSTSSSESGGHPAPGAEAVRRSRSNAGKLLRTPRRGGRLIVFLLLAVAAAFALDAAIRHGLRSIESGEFGVMNSISGGKVDAEIIISGSSRALVHYDPVVIAETSGHSTFNIALNASRIDLQVGRLESYLKHNKKPRLVVQNLDLHSLATTREIYDPALFLPYLGDEAMYRRIAKINGNAWKWKHVPLYGYAVEDLRYHWIEGLLALGGRQPKQTRVLGYEPRNLPWTGEFEALKRQNPDGVNIDFEPEGVALMRELVELCVDRDIEIMLVYSPEYHEAIPLVRNREEIFNCFREIADDYGAALIDFSDSHLGQQRELFYNSQHMNHVGAELFSRELAGRMHSLVATNGKRQAQE